MPPPPAPARLEPRRPRRARVRRKPIEGDPRAAGDAAGRLGAGDDGPTVDHDGTGPARTLRGTAVLHGAQAALLAEHLDEAPPPPRGGGARGAPARGGA